MAKITLTPAQRVAMARDSRRPTAEQYVQILFKDFFELRGDRVFGEDKSILGGLACFEGQPVTILANRKGGCLEGNLLCNFGMASPEGYRKALRLIKQAEKFHRPIITFVDTPGAYPGIGAEERGQGEAIARCLATLSGVTVPVIAIITGEGGSGGALALSVANTIIMLENAVYSILSPEGFASILWKDSTRADEACDLMRLTAQDLLEFGIADHIVEEPEEGVRPDSTAVFLKLHQLLVQELGRLRRLGSTALAARRYQKFRRMGVSTDLVGKDGNI